MVARRVKLSVSIKELSFHFEGDQDTARNVQQGIQETLGGLIETQDRVLALENKGDVIDVAPAKTKRRRKARVDQQASQSEENGRTRRKKESAVSLVLALRDEDFFSQERSLGDIQEALADKGHNLKQPAVSAAVLPLTKKKKLNRRKNDKGKYLYKKGSQ